MSCLDPRAIAEASSSDLPVAHVATCMSCRRLVEEQRSTRRIVQQMAAPVLRPAHRRQLAAEILAAADQLPARRSYLRPALAVASTALALAAAVTLWLRAHQDVASSITLPPLAANVSRIPERAVAMLEMPAPLAPAQIDAPFTVTREVHGGRELVALTEGTITIDSRATRDVDLRVATSVVHIADAKVRVQVRRGAILSVAVIAGSAEIETPQRRYVIAPETVWYSQPAEENIAVRAFREGWIALREGRNADAIAAFDRATDRSVAEDASYWAAVAAARAGDPAATARFAAFLRAFPSSPHASAAQAFGNSVQRWRVAPDSSPSTSKRR